MTASGVAKEIERKFLLRGLPDTAFSGEHFLVHHGWLPGTVIQERITANTRGAGEYWRCIKSGSGLTRIEAQEQISKELFDKLWPITDKRISKVRYKVKAESGHVWELDFFLDRPLVLAEVEFQDENDKVPIPQWLLPLMIREVTGDPAYLNISMAE